MTDLFSAGSVFARRMQSANLKRASPAEGSTFDDLAEQLPDPTTVVGGDLDEALARATARSALPSMNGYCRAAPAGPKSANKRSAI